MRDDEGGGGDKTMNICNQQSPLSQQREQAYDRRPNAYENENGTERNRKQEAKHK